MNLFRKMNETKKKNLAIIFSLGLTISIIIFLVLFPFDKDSFEKLGYLGIFISNTLSSATVLIPAPGILTTIYSTKYYNPFAIAIISSFSYVLGDFVSYIFGFGLENHMNKSKMFKKIEKLFNIHPFLFTFFWSSIPNPIFDVIGILAGASSFSIKKYFIAVTLGRIVRGFIITYISYFILK